MTLRPIDDGACLYSVQHKVDKNKTLNYKQTTGNRERRGQELYTVYTV